MGIYIHNLLDQAGDQSEQGQNSFNELLIGDLSLSDIVKSYDTPRSLSTNVYSFNKSNLDDWVEDAIRRRQWLNVNTRHKAEDD